ncbi:unnamed protein product [Caenorhabditis auriculariae]|uniref:MARVEL domain-containing protein n=1 Tax=Caenorhabditis auriculariae TaxID=2777116 RepID=A0A8S1HAS1_9PELO|nr:unnamed protein product [Caenorhabditis auriculariae]
MKWRLENSFYFFLAIRLLCVLNCVIILFCVALSQSWTSRAAAIFGMIFTLLSCLLIGSSIATIFAWDLIKMGFPKRTLFSFVFILSTLVSGVMFLLSTASCDAYNRFGCLEQYSSGTFRVAAAFCFINVVFGVADVALNFVFYFKEEKKPPDRTYDVPPISVIDSEQAAHDLYMSYQRKGQTTYV